jgi:hypothetical protein
MFKLEDGTEVISIPPNYTGITTTLSGNKYWFQEGKRHRLDGPAIEWVDGSKYWCQYGKLHRTDGPAFEWANGTKAWYQNGKLHRLDGPAWEEADACNEWWINGKQITKQTRIICIR